MLILALAIVVLIGCSSTPTTPTKSSATAIPTEPPVTATPECEVTCEYTALTENLDISISCESGPITQSNSVYHKDFKKHVAGERTYETSGNTYEIDAAIWAEGGKWNVTVEVTGGVFGDTTQTCECSD